MMIFKNKNALDMIKQLLTIFICTFLTTYNYYQILSHQVLTVMLTVKI